MASAPFWLERPSVLLDSFQFIPTREMTRAERLNALTRLLLIVVLLLVFVGPRHVWLTVLVIGLLAIVALYFFTGHRREGFWSTVQHATVHRGVDSRPSITPAEDWSDWYPESPGYRTTVDVNEPQCAHCRNTTVRSRPGAGYDPLYEGSSARVGRHAPQHPPLRVRHPAHPPTPAVRHVPRRDVLPPLPASPITPTATPSVPAPARRTELVGSMTTKLPTFFPRTGGRRFVPRSEE